MEIIGRERDPKILGYDAVEDIWGCNILKMEDR
jgi:hypothetical protein